MIGSNPTYEGKYLSFLLQEERKSDRILILCYKVIPKGGGTTCKWEKGHFGSFCILKFVEKGNLQRRSRNIWLCLADHNQIKPQSISLGIIFLKDAYLQWHILCFSRIYKLHLLFKIWFWLEFAKNTRMFDSKFFII